MNDTTKWIMIALLLLLILVGAGIVFGGLGNVFDSGKVFGPEEEPSASASPTEQAVPAPTTVTRCVWSIPCMAFEDPREAVDVMEAHVERSRRGADDVR